MEQFAERQPQFKTEPSFPYKESQQKLEGHICYWPISPPFIHFHKNLRFQYPSLHSYFFTSSVLQQLTLPLKEIDVKIARLSEFLDPKLLPSIVQKFYENEYLVTILSDVIGFIESFLVKLSHENKVNRWNVGITLKEDIDEPEWVRIFTIVKGDFRFRDLNERLRVEDRIENWIESTISDYKKENPIDEDRINEANALISIILESEKR